MLFFTVGYYKVTKKVSIDETLHLVFTKKLKENSLGIIVEALQIVTKIGKDTPIRHYKYSYKNRLRHTN